MMTNAPSKAMVATTIQTDSFGKGSSTEVVTTSVALTTGVADGTKVSRATAVGLGDGVGLGGGVVAVGSAVTAEGPNVSKTTEAITGASVPAEVMVIW